MEHRLYPKEAPAVQKPAYSRGEGQLGIVAHACNSITQEALTGGLREFEANLGSIERHYLQKL